MFGKSAALILTTLFSQTTAHAYVPPGHMVVPTSVRTHSKLKSLYLQLESQDQNNVILDVWFRAPASLRIQTRIDKNMVSSVDTGILHDVLLLAFTTNENTAFDLLNKWDITIPSEQDLVPPRSEKWDGKSSFYVKNPHAVFAPFGGVIAIKYQTNTLTEKGLVNTRPSAFFQKNNYLFQGYASGSPKNLSVLLSNFGRYENSVDIPKYLFLFSPTFPKGMKFQVTSSGINMKTEPATFSKGFSPKSNAPTIPEGLRAFLE